jgi:hypothetical protein
MIELPPTAKDERTGVHHMWKIGTAGVIAVVTVTTLVILSKPPAPSGVENGSFGNDCCGSLTLRDGAMILNDKPTTRYTVGRDAKGPYILPRSYVGGLDGVGFEIDGSRPTAKLRLDRLPHPTTLLVQGGRTTYMFKRQPGTTS